MSYTMRLRLRRAERALERLLGLVSRRGYVVEYLSVQPSADQELFDVTLRVDGGRNGDVLLRQIRKLNDVARVETLDADRPAASNNGRDDVRGGTVPS